MEYSLFVCKSFKEIGELERYCSQNKNYCENISRKTVTKFVRGGTIYEVTSRPHVKVNPGALNVKVSYPLDLWIWKQKNISEVGTVEHARLVRPYQQQGVDHLPVLFEDICKRLGKENKSWLYQILNKIHRGRSIDTLVDKTFGDKGGDLQIYIKVQHSEGYCLIRQGFKGGNTAAKSRAEIQNKKSDDPYKHYLLQTFGY